MSYNTYYESITKLSKLYYLSDNSDIKKFNLKEINDKQNLNDKEKEITECIADFKTILLNKRIINLSDNNLKSENVCVNEKIFNTLMNKYNNQVGKLLITKKLSFYVINNILELIFYYLKNEDNYTNYNHLFIKYLALLFNNCLEDINTLERYNKLSNNLNNIKINNKDSCFLLDVNFENNKVNLHNNNLNIEDNNKLLKKIEDLLFIILEHTSNYYPLEIIINLICNFYYKEIYLLKVLNDLAVAIFNVIGEYIVCNDEEDLKDLIDIIVNLLNVEASCNDNKRLYNIANLNNNTLLAINYLNLLKRYVKYEYIVKLIDNESIVDFNKNLEKLHMHNINY